jgi:hypothetical protein
MRLFKTAHIGQDDGRAPLSSIGPPVLPGGNTTKTEMEFELL